MDWPEAAATVALNARLCWARVENAVFRVPWLRSLSGVVALETSLTVFFSCSVSSSAALLEEMLGKIGEEKCRGGEDRLKVKQRGIVFDVVEARVSGVDAFRILGFPEDGPHGSCRFVQTDALQRTRYEG